MIDYDEEEVIAIIEDADSSKVIRVVGGTVEYVRIVSPSLFIADAMESHLAESGPIGTGIAGGTAEVIGHDGSISVEFNFDFEV